MVKQGLAYIFEKLTIRMTNVNVQKNQTTIKRDIIPRAEEILVSLKRFVYCRLYTVKGKHKRSTGN